ncbi:hypothetical protein CASFOL_029299 [Castilleja foliolosa]|uniref:Uncharacterized protein n=1 Tax=Castilleja foliolosa TaxID=1961234 RepID=A0ABD3CBD8_9LAMI
MEFHHRIPHEGDMDVAAEGNEYGKSPLRELSLTSIQRLLQRAALQNLYGYLSSYEMSCNLENCDPTRAPF